MIASSILLGRAAAPVEQSIAGWRALLKARSAKERLNLLLAHAEDTSDRMELPIPQGGCRWKNATVVLPGRQDPLLLDVTLSLQPGHAAGADRPVGGRQDHAGPRAGGAATAVRGMCASMMPPSPTGTLNRLARHIGFLPQQVELFRGTVARQHRP
ncbi:hypothetical protein [Phaeobacter inhibens]|uniref:hypothetical protein n=1 Tax=Phaeobacter inhibens TaxID=221822 RepID=UPI0021A435E8|nr:hypothetical protein [Phaeobacter inhibens]